MSDADAPSSPPSRERFMRRTGGGARDVPPRQVLFDPTPEIFATGSDGSFLYPLNADGESFFDALRYDEVRFVFSLWHPSSKRTIDLDRAYLELRACFDPEETHWIKLSEIEPVVPPYVGGDSFDGWIVLPVLAGRCAYALYGNGFEGRARLQIRANAYFVP